MANTLDDVLKDVTDEGTMIDGLSTLLSGLSAQVKGAAGDQTKIDAIFAAAEANKAKIAAALAANPPATPPAPAPAPAPAPPAAGTPPAP